MSETSVLEMPEVRKMAGVVRATAYYSESTDGLEIVPDRCPAADVHRKRAEEHYKAEAKKWAEAHGLPDAPAMRPAPTYLKCSTIDQRGRRRWCRYYYGLTDHRDETIRLDLSMLGKAAFANATRQAPCCVLCAGAARNRPPGV